MTTEILESVYSAMGRLQLGFIDATIYVAVGLTADTPSIFCLPKNDIGEVERRRG